MVAETAVEAAGGGGGDGVVGVACMHYPVQQYLTEPLQRCQHKD